MYMAYCKAGLDPKSMTLISKALLSHKSRPITENGESAKINCHSTENSFFGPGKGSLDGTNTLGDGIQQIKQGIFQTHKGRTFHRHKEKEKIGSVTRGFCR